MHRISIWKAMLVVSFVATNLAALKYLLSEVMGSRVLLPFLVGLLPLADAQVICFYLIAERYRLSARRQTGGVHSPGFFAFTVSNAVSLMILIAVFFRSSNNSVITVLRLFTKPIENQFLQHGFTYEDFSAPYFRIFVSPVILGAVISGPFLVLSLFFGWIVNRYQSIIPRKTYS